MPPGSLVTSPDLWETDKKGDQSSPAGALTYTVGSNNDLMSSAETLLPRDQHHEEFELEEITEQAMLITDSRWASIQ